MNRESLLVSLRTDISSPPLNGSLFLKISGLLSYDVFGLFCSEIHDLDAVYCPTKSEVYFQVE
jgi:hypothetical protein